MIMVRAMKLKTLVFIALAALVAACSPVNANTDAADLGEAQEAFVTYNDPSAVVDAINGGATWSAGALVISDVPNYLVLSAGVWSLSDVSGDTISRGAWRRLQGSTVRLDAGEYQWCIDTSGGLLTLNEVDGVATLEDPE